MIIVKPTEHLIGISVQGDYNDFDAIEDAAHRLSGPMIDEDYSDPYYAVSNRLLAICYDIRHAKQGDRDTVLMGNGLTDEIIEYHDIDLPKETVYFSVNILYPEALFFAASLEEYLQYAAKYYGKQGSKTQEQSILHFTNKYSEYIKDCSVVRNLAGHIWASLGEILDDAEFERIMKLRRGYHNFSYYNYAVQYIDKLDYELVKASPEKRPSKLKSIARGILEPKNAYYQLLFDFQEAARLEGHSMYEFYDSKTQLPEEIIW